MRLALFLVSYFAIGWSLFFPALSHAEIEEGRRLFFNTLEARSVFVSDKEMDRLIQQAQENPSLGHHWESLFEAFAYNASQGECDVDLMAELNRELDPSDSKLNLKTILSYWRARNWIDDIVLSTLLKVEAVWDKIKEFPERHENPKPTDDSNDDSNDPAQVFQKLPSCETTAFLSSYQAARAQLKGKFSDKAYRELLQNAVKENKIEPLKARWLEELSHQNHKKYPWNLPIAVQKMKAVKTPKPGASSYASSKVHKTSFNKPYRGLTQRLSLYAKFSSIQILLLSDTFRQFIRRMSAESVNIHIHNKDETEEIYHLSPLEQYRMASKMLHKELLETRNSGHFKGTIVEYNDLINASLETGLISGDEIDQMLAVEEIWNPKKTKAEKIMGIIRRFGGPALVFVPPAYSLLSSFGLVIVEYLISSKKITAADDRGVSIF